MSVTLKDKTGCWHGDYLPKGSLMEIEKGNAVVCPNCLILISRFDGRLQYREITKVTIVGGHHDCQENPAKTL